MRVVIVSIDGDDMRVVEGSDDSAFSFKEWAGFHVLFPDVEVRCRYKNTSQKLADQRVTSAYFNGDLANPRVIAQRTELRTVLDELKRLKNQDVDDHLLQIAVRGQIVQALLILSRYEHTKITKEIIDEWANGSERN